MGLEKCSHVTPVLQSFAGSYFLNQKLSIMNATYNQLRPQVRYSYVNGKHRVVHIT